MLGFLTEDRSGPRGLRGRRAYVVGDVHGRLDLLDQLLAEIEREVATCKSTKPILVFLGDLIDRGSQSAQVIERLRTYRHRSIRTVFLLGNHEEVLLRILNGEASFIANWQRFGGSECLKSYGVDVKQLETMDETGKLEVIRKAIPRSHLEFLCSFSDTCRFGDYLFVHAGIRPGVELDRQKQSDLRWIREAFLTDSSDHGVVVVHGHTISRNVVERSNRIGIDTGAYKTGVLTALVIEGRHRRLLTTAATGDVIAEPAH